MVTLSQRLAAVRQAITGLPPTRRLAVTLVFGPSEAARIMNISPRSLELYRARRTLARQLGPLLEE